MFDKLDDILMRLEEVLNQLSEPDVAADAAKFQKLRTYISPMSSGNKFTKDKKSSYNIFINS